MGKKQAPTPATDPYARITARILAELGRGDAVDQAVERGHFGGTHDAPALHDRRGL